MSPNSYIARLIKLYPVSDLPAGGFILPDGRFLSLEETNGRQDHRNINQVIVGKRSGCRTLDMCKLMFKVNLVRYGSESGWVHLVRFPTGEQIESTKSLLAYHSCVSIEIQRFGFSECYALTQDYEVDLESTLGAMLRKIAKRRRAND